MIKVERAPKPEKLTDELQSQLTEEFKKDKTKPVWNKAFIKKALLEESNNKCVYCECMIGKGYKEMHVDHFHYKDKYEDEVLMWDNLNPSCPQCNKNKSTHDTYKEPIVNPFNDDPKEFFYLKNYRYYSKNDSVMPIVQKTIDVLGLNDTDKIVKFRFEIGDALSNKIKEIYDNANNNKTQLTTDIGEKNKVLRGCRNILSKGTKTAPFSAFMATIIKNDEYYAKTKELLKELDLWDEELDVLDKEVDLLKMATDRDKTA